MPGLGLARHETTGRPCGVWRDVQRPFTVKCVPWWSMWRTRPGSRYWPVALSCGKASAGPAVPQPLARPRRIPGRGRSGPRVLLGAAEVQRIAGVGRGDEVPAGAALADVVDRGEAGGRPCRARRRCWSPSRPAPTRSVTMRDSRTAASSARRRPAAPRDDWPRTGRAMSMSRTPLPSARNTQSNLPRSAISVISMKPSRFYDRLGESILVTPAAEMAADQVRNAGDFHHRVRSFTESWRASQCGTASSWARGIWQGCS